jgi:hypothetical protein
MLQGLARSVAVTNLSCHENGKEEAQNQREYFAGGSVRTRHSLMLPGYYYVRKLTIMGFTSHHSGKSPG